jgi:hypothetical protein
MACSHRHKQVPIVLFERWVVFEDTHHIKHFDQSQFLVVAHIGYRRGVL